MKILLNYLITAIVAIGFLNVHAAAAIVVAPNGVVAAAGTVAAPTTLETALGKVAVGDTILMRGGTYNQSATIVIAKDGTAGAPIRVFAYSNEVPVISFSAMPEATTNRGVIMDADYWHWRGIVIEQAGDNGMLLSGNNNTIEKCVFRRNHDSGLQLSRFNTTYNTISQWPSDNLIVSCEAYDNSDSGHENADGFAPKLTSGNGNIFRNCVSHHNIDDGWDMYAKLETGPIGAVTLEGCIAHHNGALTDGATSGNGDKNGFKLGSSDGILVNHIVRRCIAFQNGKHGFTDNGNTASIEFTNNSAWFNADYNYHTRDGATHVFKNNLSFAGVHTDRIVGTVSAPNALTDTDTDWPLSASAADFVTMTPGPDNNPTSNGFLSLKTGSRLIDAGVVTPGIQYAGSAPDIGAMESGLTVGAKSPAPAERDAPQALALSVRGSVICIAGVSCADIDGTFRILNSAGRVVGEYPLVNLSQDGTFSILPAKLASGVYQGVLRSNGGRYGTGTFTIAR